MSFTVSKPLPLYAGLSGITIRIMSPGSSTRVNGDADDAMSDTAADGLFVATVAEDELADTYTYKIFRSGTVIQTGWFNRQSGQAAVVLDDPRDYTNLAVGLYAIAVTVDDDNADPIRSAAVWIDGSADVVYTDQFGAATLYAATRAEAYTVRCNPPRGYEAVDAQTVTIAAADEAVAFVAASTLVAAPDDPDLCTVTLPTTDQYGTRHADVPVTLTFLGFVDGASPPAVVVPVTDPIESDDDGLVEVTLYKYAKYRASYQIGTSALKRSVEFTTTGADSYNVVDSVAA